MVLFLTAILIVMIVLDRMKILQYNSIPIFLIYLYCSPILIGLSTMYTSLALGVVGLVVLSPGASWNPAVILILLLVCAGVVVFDLYILIRICKYPINEKKIKNRSYDAACLKRLTFYRRAAFIPAVILLLLVVIYAVKNAVEITAMLVVNLANPFVWLLALVTGGAILGVVILGAVVMAVVASYIAFISEVVAIWLYIMFLAFSYVQLFRIYRLGEIKLSRAMLMALALYIFPVSLFVSPILTKMAKHTAQGCDDKLRQQQAAGFAAETAAIKAAEEIWNDNSSDQT